MPVIQVEANLTVEQLLQAAKQLPEAELNAFVWSLNTLPRKSKLAVLSPRESFLLLKINEAISTEAQNRLHKLVRQRQNDTLSDVERQELLQLTEEAERIDVARLACLVELSQLRGRSLDEIMDELEIRQPAVI